MNTDFLLNTDPFQGLVTLISKLALGDTERDALAYLTALNAAIAAEPPPYDTHAYAEIYRSASTDPRWMAVSLITNAEREGDGSKRLWSLAACCPKLDHQEKLKSHAIDESRHSLMYLRMLDLSFPGATEPGFRTELNELSPHFSAKQQLAPVVGSPYAKEPTIDDYVQMNIAEIRTTIHHILQRPALAKHSPLENQSKITAIQNSLLRDELAHVAYTARLIEELAIHSSQDELHELFQVRFRNFNTITSNELGDTVFDCSVACCNKRQHCRAKSTSVVQLSM